MKILIMGAGALGSVFGGFLSKINEVTMIGRDPHMKMVAKQGLKISGIWGDHVFKNIRAFASVKDLERQDLVLITTKAYDTEVAARQILPLLGSKSVVISMQNGIGNEEVIAGIVGEDRTMGGMAIFGAFLKSPAHVAVTVYASECLVGELCGMSERAKNIAEMFSDAGIPTLPTDDVIAEKWVKAFYNMALNPLSAILRVPYGFLGEHEETKRIMKEMLKEAFEIADAEGINLRFTWQTYFDYLMMGQLPPTSKHKSSMLQDIEKGKKTEVDYLNGVIVSLGKKHGIATPVNETITGIIKSLEKKD